MKKSIIFVLTLLAGITTVNAAEPETQTDSVAQEQNAPKVTVKKNAGEAAAGEKVYDVNGDGEINITDYITLSSAIAVPPYNSITANKFADIYDGNGKLRLSSYDYNNDKAIDSKDSSILLEKIKTNK